MRNFLDYYSRKEIQRAILESSISKEMSVMFGENGFGKRPDTLNYESDVLDLARQGATSFHVSEEHWRNPLQLTVGMNKHQFNELRTGWDFILDIDSPELKYSKIITHFLIEALKFHNIKNISVKYSGNRGFHIGLSFKSLPEKIGKEETQNLFPDAARIIAEYLTEMIKPYMKEKLKGDIDNLLKVDTVLISNRHLYRAPYSLHEKTGLVSMPIDAEDVLDFNKDEALPEKVFPRIKFLDKYEKNEAEELVKRAYEWNHERSLRKEKVESSAEAKDYKDVEVTDMIPEEFFPDSIKTGLKGIKDGKKRFLFILINFLKSVGWGHEDISKRVIEWNKNNPEPLKEGYIISQLSWHKRQKEKILPPNYTNDAYYKDLGLDCSEDIRKGFKNPVNYAVRMYKLHNSRKTKKTNSKPYKANIIAKNNGKNQDKTN